jgi:dihydrofolate reductase
MKPLTIVVAMNFNRVIGKGNGIPWDLAEDRKHFVNVTSGHPIIMGRKTWDSIGRPLPKRRNIVISRGTLELPTGVELASGLLEAIDLARQTDDDPRIIGGGQIYAESLPLATRIYMTEINDRGVGDVFFPLLDSRWVETDSVSTESARYVTYDAAPRGMCGGRSTSHGTYLASC